MGVNAYFGVKFKEPPTETRLKQLRFHLIHRFGDILEWGNKDNLKELFELRQSDSWLREETETDGDIYTIDTLVRYYGPGYERGPGLEIAGLLLYLCKQPDIERVYYGGDGLRPIDEQYAIDLLVHWLDNRRLPYLTSPWGKDHPWYKEPPTCERCEMPMVDVGGGGGKTFWMCPGCQIRKDL